MAIKMNSKTRRNRTTTGGHQVPNSTGSSSSNHAHPLNSSGSSINSSPNSMPSPGHHGNPHANSRSNRSSKNANQGYGSASSSNSGPSGPQPPIKAEGAYGNLRLMHTTTSLMGCVVQVQLKNERTYEGVLKTFSPKYELVLETVIQVEKNSSLPNGSQNIGSLLASLHGGLDPQKTMIFALADIVKLTAKNVDVDYALKGQFQTDTEITNRNKDRFGSDERELVPWEPDADDSGSVDDLEGLNESGPDNDLNWRKRRTSRNGSSQNGWDAADMFKKNESLGVRSDFDEEMKIYTVPLQKENTEEWKKKEEEAARLAKMIEGSEKSKRYKELEDGDENADEEAVFSAVVRPSKAPSETGHQPKPSRNTRDENIPPRHAKVPPPKSHPQGEAFKESRVSMKAPHGEMRPHNRESERVPRRTHELPDGPRPRRGEDVRDPRDFRPSAQSRPSHDSRPSHPNQIRSSQPQTSKPSATPSNAGDAQSFASGVQQQQPLNPRYVPSQNDMPSQPPSYARIAGSATAPKHEPRSGQAPSQLPRQNTRPAPYSPSPSASPHAPAIPQQSHDSRPDTREKTLKSFNQNFNLAKTGRDASSESSNKARSEASLGDSSGRGPSKTPVSTSSHQSSSPVQPVPPQVSEKQGDSPVPPGVKGQASSSVPSSGSSKSVPVGNVPPSKLEVSGDTEKSSPSSTNVKSSHEDGPKEPSTPAASEAPTSAKNESSLTTSDSADKKSKSKLNPDAAEFTPRFLVQPPPSIPIAPGTANNQVPSTMGGVSQPLPASTPGMAPASLPHHIPSQAPVHSHPQPGHPQASQSISHSHHRQPAHQQHSNSQMVSVQPTTLILPSASFIPQNMPNAPQHYVFMQPLQNPVPQPPHSQQSNIVPISNVAVQGTHPPQHQASHQNQHQQSGPHAKGSRGSRGSGPTNQPSMGSTHSSNQQPSFTGQNVSNRPGQEYHPANPGSNPATGTPLITSAPMQVPTSMYGSHIITPSGQPNVYPYQMAGNRAIIVPYDPSAYQYLPPGAHGHYFAGSVQPVQATPHGQGHGQQGSNPPTPHSHTPNTTMHPNASPSPHQQQQGGGVQQQAGGLQHPVPSGTPNQQQAHTPTPQASIMYHQAPGQPNQAQGHHPGMAATIPSQAGAHPMQQTPGSNMQHQQHYYLVGAAGFHPLPTGAVPFSHQAQPQPQGPGASHHQTNMPGQPHVGAHGQVPGQPGAIQVQAHQHHMQPHAVPVSLITSQPYAMSQHQPPQGQHPVQMTHQQSQQMQHNSQNRGSGGGGSQGPKRNRN